MLVMYDTKHQINIEILVLCDSLAKAKHNGHKLYSYLRVKKENERITVLNKIMSEYYEIKYNEALVDNIQSLRKDSRTEISS
jgi:hypothetical protein